MGSQECFVEQTLGESPLQNISKLVPGYIEKQDSLEAFDIDMTDPETKDKKSAQDDTFTNKEDQEKNNKSVVEKGNVKKLPEKEESNENDFDNELAKENEEERKKQEKASEEEFAT